MQNQTLTFKGAKGFPRGLCKVKVVIAGNRGKEGGEMERRAVLPGQRASASLPATHTEWGLLRVVAELHAGPSTLTRSTGLSNDMKNFHTEVSGQESSRFKKKKKSRPRQGKGHAQGGERRVV